MPNSVLIAGHSQEKYFDQYLKSSNVDVVSFSSHRIEQCGVSKKSSLSRRGNLVFNKRKTITSS